MAPPKKDSARPQPAFRDLDYNLIDASTIEQAVGGIGSQPNPPRNQNVVAVPRRITANPRTKSIQRLQLRFPPPPQQLLSLRQQVLYHIRQRLKSIQVDTSHLPDIVFAWALPKLNASAKDWNQLLLRPLTVSSEQLCTMFKLRKSAANYDLPADTTIFYVRVFTFGVGELLDVIQALIDERMGTQTKGYMLFEETAHLKDGDKVYVKYCGTSSTYSGHKRHEQDLYTPRQTFVSMFLQKALELYPEVVDSCEVYEFVEAEIVVPAKSDEIADVREQSLIALFGLPTLLNTSYGGIGPHVRFQDLDNDQFISLRTSLFPKLSHYSEVIQQYANQHPNSTGAGRYPINEDVRKAIVDSASARFVKDQNYTLMLTVGSDFPLNMRESLQPWWNGGFAAADVTIEVLNNFVRCELGHGTDFNYVKSMVDMCALPFVNLFPWTKKTMEDLKEALQMLRQYLQISRPLIVLTFSNLVSSAACTNFQHGTGYSVPNITQAAGIPVMGKYDEKMDVAADENCCVIVPCMHPGVLRYSTSTEDVIMRLLTKALSIAWVAMDGAVGLIPNSTTKKALCQDVINHVRAKTGPETEFGKEFKSLKEQYLQHHQDVYKLNKGQLGKFRKTGDKKTQEAIARVQKSSVKVAPADVIKRTAELATGEPEAEDESVRRVLDHGEVLVIQTARVRWRRALQQLYIVTDCGCAYGQPNPKERKVQVDSIAAIGLDHLMVDDLETTKQRFLNTARGQLFFFEANSLDAQLSTIPDLLAVFLSKHDPATNEPVLVDNADWRRNKLLCQIASADMQQWILDTFVNQGRRSTTTFEQNVLSLPDKMQVLLAEKDPSLAYRFRLQRQKEGKDVSVFEQNGQEVIIRPGRNVQHKASLNIRWAIEDLDYEIQDLPLPAGCSPLTVGEPRHLFFVPQGLDIRDGAGRSLGVSGDRAVTLPLQHLIAALADNPMADEFLELWSAVTGLSADDVLYADIQPMETLSVSCLPPEAFNTRQLPFETKHGLSIEKRVAELNKSLPFQPGDAAWLVNEFLEHYIPQEGVIDCGSRDHFPDSDPVWAHLTAFLQNPRYKNHPHLRNMVATTAAATGEGRGLNNETTKVVANLTVVVRVLRSSVEVKKAQSSVGQRKRKTMLHIGAARSHGAVIKLDAAPDTVPLLGDQAEFVDEDDDENDEGAADQGTLLAEGRRGKRRAVSDDEEEDDHEAQLARAKRGKRRA